MSELWEGIDIGVSISLRSFSLVVNSLKSDATENAVRLEHEQSRIKMKLKASSDQTLRSQKPFPKLP